MKLLYANRIAPDGMLHYVASYLVLYCLPMSHKKDVRLILVKIFLNILVQVCVLELC